jgi:hydroxymethylglutaryl-CoA lyase
MTAFTQLVSTDIVCLAGLTFPALYTTPAIFHASTEPTRNTMKRYTGLMPLTYVECPRDAWQGLSHIIPTAKKVAFIQQLIDAGFKHLDMGSFVSPKAVPQLADTEDVLAQLTVPKGVDLLTIVANQKGLERALAATHLTSVGFPLSVNETFQQRNANQSLTEAWALVHELSIQTSAHHLGLVVYLSMGFGNPYGEPWASSDTASAVSRLRETGIARIALADTIGSATPERLKAVLEATEAPETLGLHLHAKPDDWQETLEVALDYGMTWFEGALAGVGGCPFATDTLVGNLPTEQVLPWLSARGYTLNVNNLAQLQEAALALSHPPRSW